jgi:integral membrane protein (TIGR01906 family)
MDDVQTLFKAVRGARLVAGAVLLILPLVGLGLVGSGFLPRLGTLLTIGGVVTVVLLGLLGLLSLVDFTEAFVKFHQMAFSNDDWMLDPRTDYLIMLYPEGFWIDATLRIAMLSAVEAVVLGGVGLGITYFGGRR